MWTTENLDPHYSFAKITNSTAGFYWIAQQTMMENKRGQEDIDNLRLEVNTFLKAISQTSSNL